MDVTSPKALVGQIQALIGSHSDEDLPKDKRLQACQLARKLWLELEEPGDSVDRLIFQVSNYDGLEIYSAVSLIRHSLKRTP